MKVRKKNLVKTIIRPLALVLVFGGLITFGSCSNDDNSGTNPGSELQTSALYDTLGWFIQGGHGEVVNQGTKMISDPDHPGEQIQAGRLAIRTVVEKSLNIIAADPELAEYFPTLLNEVGQGNTTGLSNLLGNFTDFVQQGVSGQEVYEGKTMIKVHNHETYSRFGSSEHPVADEASFNQFINDVVEAAQSLDVPDSVIAQLGDLLTSVEGDVVQG